MVLFEMFSGIHPEMTLDETVWRSLFLFYNERHMGMSLVDQCFFFKLKKSLTKSNFTPCDQLKWLSLKITKIWALVFLFFILIAKVWHFQYSQPDFYKNLPYFYSIFDAFYAKKFILQKYL